MSKDSLMSRPTKIATEDLLDVARRLFVQKGYMVTTAEIAKEAGVSEGTIFKRFPTKAELFRAAMGCPSLSLGETFADLAGKGSLEENMLHVLSTLLDFIRRMHPWAVKLHAHPTINPVEILRDDPDPPPFRVRRKLADYLEAEMRHHRLRKVDAEAIATILIGAVHSYVFLNSLRSDEPTSQDDERYLKKIIDALLRGLRP